MKKKTIRILALVVGLIFAVTVISTAATGQKQLAVIYNNIKLVIDGQQITPKDARGNTVEPFTYNGTTYLPVRAVAEALGKEVVWDSVTSTVIIGEPGTVSVTKQPQGEVTYLDTLAGTSFDSERSVSNYSSISSNSRTRDDKSYSRGVCIKTSKKSILTYPLNEDYNTFVSDIYFPFIGWGTGPVVVKIYGDNKLLYTSPSMTTDTLTQSVKLDVAGISQLQIEVSDTASIVFADAQLIN